MDINSALSAFDATEANLKKLEDILVKMGEIESKTYHYVSEDERLRERYDELDEAWRAITRAVPSIGGVRITATPVHPDLLFEAGLEQEQGREYVLRYEELRDEAREAGEQLARYRESFAKKRRSLVRGPLQEVTAEMTRLLAELATTMPRSNQKVETESIDELRSTFREVERLCGGHVSENGRWENLRRHLSWGEGSDVHELHELDWPSVQKDIADALYSALEAVPVGVPDLAAVVEANPTGRVTTKLAWSNISDEEFERLLFNIVSDTEGYENPRLLTRTNAPDRGRDLSCERMRRDALSGARIERVLIQAKHYQKTSVSVTDISVATAQMDLWTPPVDVLIFATSGRFTIDAVSWIEGHNQKGIRPTIEMWPESHLEYILARRPYLIAGFGLNSP